MKVAKMLQDQRRTRFVVICIAEYLSISETQRLLQDLKKCEVQASHVVVNQLVNAFLTKEDTPKLDTIAPLDPEFVAKVKSCCQLTTARHGLQSKYLNELKKFEEVVSDGIEVLEIPLLPTEITGPKALVEFSHLFVTQKVDVDPAKQQALDRNQMKGTGEYILLTRFDSILLELQSAKIEGSFSFNHGGTYH